MKYIVFKNLGLVVFEDGIDHESMARRLDDEPVSAGFTRAGSCFGESLSLNLFSRPEDTGILRRKMSWTPTTSR